MTTKTTTTAENGVCTSLANHGDGTFGKWCKERCGIGKSTAYRYLTILDVFGDAKELVCPTGGQTFDAKALEYLANDTTPEEATRDALKLAKNLAVGQA